MQEYVNRHPGKDFNYHTFTTFPRPDTSPSQKGRTLELNPSTSTFGKLIMAANTLGETLDIPPRSLIQLREADLLVFEEDRAARQALKAAGIHRDYLRWSEHREEATLDAVKKALSEARTVLFMSAQGMPTVADPGRDLLELAYRMGANVSVIPGPSSITAALAACSFLENGFIFLGFLPREENQRRLTLEKAGDAEVPLVILETPYRQRALLESVAAVYGETRMCLLAEDISGPHESYCEKPLSVLLERNREKLNFVLIVAPGAKKVPEQHHHSDRKASFLDKADKSDPRRPQRQQSAPPAKRLKVQTSSRKQKPKR